MELTNKQQKNINSIGKKFDLRYIIIHGSFAQNNNKPGSDLDIAIYGKQTITPSKRIEIHGELGSVLGDNKERELDLKTLHNTNPLFRWEVVRTGILIYGDKKDYDQYYVYATKDYNDSKSLLELRDHIIEKTQKELNKTYAQ